MPPLISVKHKTNTQVFPRVQSQKQNLIITKSFVMAESTTAVYAVIDESMITSDNVYTQVSKTEQGKEAEATIQNQVLQVLTNKGQGTQASNYLPAVLSQLPL
jgi:hypothetical protein